MVRVDVLGVGSMKSLVVSFLLGERSFQVMIYTLYVR